MQLLPAAAILLLCGHYVARSCCSASLPLALCPPLCRPLVHLCLQASVMRTLLPATAHPTQHTAGCRPRQKPRKVPVCSPFCHCCCCCFPAACRCRWRGVCAMLAGLVTQLTKQTPTTPAGSRPVRQGRPMNWWCQPKGSFGGSRDWDDLFGPQGWCTAAEPKIQCDCNVPGGCLCEQCGRDCYAGGMQAGYLAGCGLLYCLVLPLLSAYREVLAHLPLAAGWSGPTCEQPVEQFCFNSCNGRGECLGGYCRCHPGAPREQLAGLQGDDVLGKIEHTAVCLCPCGQAGTQRADARKPRPRLCCPAGWHGIDCAHSSAAADTQSPGLEQQRPWLAEHIHTPAAQRFPANATRMRPLIYV